jgi:phosphate transport system substrate-binding protein
VKANFESVGAGLDSVTSALPADLRAVATNGQAKDAYPMASLTFLIVPSKFEDPAKRDLVKKFLTWAYDINAGQKAVLAFDYNALPPKILDEARSQVDRIQ